MNSGVVVVAIAVPILIKSGGELDCLLCLFQAGLVGLCLQTCKVYATEVMEFQSIVIMCIVSPTALLMLMILVPY